MKMEPFGLFNIFNFSAFKKLNWFEGLKRIKLVVQWTWFVFVGFFICMDIIDGTPFSFFFWFLCIVVPILATELLFKAIVWVIAGFLKDEGGVR